MTTPTIKPIETRYKGYRFRSRLEARWAVFLDTLNIPWEYEPQGYELRAISDEEVQENFLIQGGPHLGYYLPDFWLPNHQAWFEVKGEYPSDQEWDRIWRFQALVHPIRVFVTTGNIPDPTSVDIYGPEGQRADGWEPIYVFGDADYAWCCCTICGFPDIQFQGRSARNVCGCRPGASDRCYNGDDPRILAGYDAARAARFEHGEIP